MRKQKTNYIKPNDVALKLSCYHWGEVDSSFYFRL